MEKAFTKHDLKVKINFKSKLFGNFHIEGVGNSKTNSSLLETSSNGSKFTEGRKGGRGVHFSVTLDMVESWVIWTPKF